MEGSGRQAGLRVVAEEKDIRGAGQLGRVGTGRWNGPEHGSLHGAERGSSRVPVRIGLTGIKKISKPFKVGR